MWQQQQAVQGCNYCCMQGQPYCWGMPGTFCCWMRSHVEPEQGSLMEKFLRSRSHSCEPPFLLEQHQKADFGAHDLLPVFKAPLTAAPSHPSLVMSNILNAVSVKRKHITPQEYLCPSPYPPSSRSRWKPCPEQKLKLWPFFSPLPEVLTCRFQLKKKEGYTLLMSRGN